MPSIKKVLQLTKSIYKNVFCKNDVIIITEFSNWVAKESSLYIKLNLEKKYKVKVSISHLPFFLRNKVVYFSSIHTFIKKRGLVKLHKSNKIILTWYHVKDNDKRLKFISEINNFVDIVHTSCHLTKDILIANGLFKEKIKVIPLGIDLHKFKFGNPQEIDFFKKKLGIGKKAVVIGSFQKDGVGWAEGLEPKLIKGPDIFCDVVEKLSLNNDIHVMLTGPARGYVKKRLDNANIKYSHIYLENYLDIIKYYQILDLYIISSRIEGGPMSLLESLACGVPLVSTKVGMVPDFIVDRVNGALADVDDVKSLILRSEEIINNKEIQQNIRNNGVKSISNLDWSIIVERYFNELFKSFLKK